MPWNRAMRGPRPIKKKSRTLRYIITVVILAFTGFIGFSIFRGAEAPVKENTTQQKKYKSVIRKSSKPKLKKAEKKIQETISTTPVEVLTPKTTLHDRLAQRKFGVGNNVHTTKVDRIKSDYEIFKHRSENHLAFLISVPLGTSVVGSRKMTPRFMDDLIKSLDEEIEIFEDDTEAAKHLKRSVTLVKNELKQMLKSGEDISKVLTDTFNEIQKMGVIKKNLESEIRKARRNPEMSDADMKDLVDAANIMLGEKGISPINYNPVTRSIIRARISLDNDEKE